MVSEVSQCSEQPKRKKVEHIPKLTAIIHIVISMMYFVYTFITNINPCKDITVVLGINTVIVFLKGIIGLGASKRPSLLLSKVYINLSVLSGLWALWPLVVSIQGLISCDVAYISISTIVTGNVLLEILNCILSVIVLRKIINRLKQGRANQNADELGKLEDNGQSSNSKNENSTIDDDLAFTINQPSNIDGHPLEDNTNGFVELHSFLPTATSQQSQNISPEYESEEKIYIEMDENLTSNAECPSQVMTFFYDDVAPMLPLRTKRSSRIPNSFTLVNSYMELCNKSDPPRDYAHFADIKHALERRQTYFHKKFASRFQPLADDQTLSSVFLVKMNKYHNAFAERLRCAVSNGGIYPVAVQSPVEDESEKNVGELFPRPRCTSQDKHLHSVERRPCLSDVKSTNECTSSKTEPGQRKWSLYGDCNVNFGGMVKSLQQRITAESQLLPVVSSQESDLL